MTNTPTVGIEPFVFSKGGTDFVSGKCGPLFSRLCCRHPFALQGGMGGSFALALVAGVFFFGTLATWGPRDGWPFLPAPIALWVLCAGGVVATVYGRRQSQGLWRLVNEGERLTGRVIKCSGAEDDGGYEVAVEYEFLAPDGRRITAMDYALRDDLRTEALPGAGHAVLVLYHGNGYFVLL